MQVASCLPTIEGAACSTVTVQVAVLLPSSVVTVMVAVPALTAVTVPFCTVATLVLLLVHVTFWFVALAGIVLLIVACIAVYVWALKAAARRTLSIAHTPLEASALAMVCMLLVSLAINDSGIAIPLSGLSFMSPLWILAYARCSGSA